jgi:hypothetical protein
MTPLEAKIILLHRQIGPFLQLKADEALAIAVDCEQTAKDVGPFDPAFPILIEKSRHWFEAAQILERREQT